MKHPFTRQQRPNRWTALTALAAFVMAGCGGGDEAQRVDDYPSSVTMADGTRLTIDSQSWLIRPGLTDGHHCAPTYFVTVTVRSSSSPFPLQVDLSGAEVWKQDRRLTYVEYSRQATPVPDDSAIENLAGICPPSGIQPGDHVVVAAEVGIPGAGRVHLKGEASLVTYVD